MIWLFWNDGIDHLFKAFFNIFSMLGLEAELLTIKILEKISENYFVFLPFRSSSWKPPSAGNNNREYLW
jgi:hypothetical protein